MSGIKWNFAHEEAFDRMHRMIADHPVASSQIGGRNFGSVPANRLISSGISNNAVNPLSTGATYAYNAQGQRVTRVEDEVVTHFYYTGSALLFTTVNEYVLQTQNILDPSGTIVASKRFEGQAATGQDPYAEDYFFYRYDIRGSVTNIVDGAGAVVKSYDYDEFGVTTSTGDAFFNEVTFTGSISDASGLLYMNARYYNPTTARFLSQDSYSGNPYDPWTQHLYSYCGNNPINMVDPTGHFFLSCLIVGTIVGAVIGGGVVGYQDYKDDGQIFNGSKTFGDYVLGAAIGGAAGGAAGAVVGAVGAAGGVGAVAKTVGAGVKSAASWVGAKATAAWTAIATQGKKIAEGAKQVVSKIVDGVKQIGTKISDAFRDIGSKPNTNQTQSSTALQTYYPPNNGFSGSFKKVTLDSGTVIQRTGDFAGRFTAPAGTPSQMLALPYDKIGQATTYLQATQPIQALSGRVAPWFGQIGGGTQYLLLDGRVDELISNGVLRIFGG